MHTANQNPLRLVAWSAFFILLLFLSVSKYLSLHSTFYDLGFYHNLIYRFSVSTPWAFLFNTHANLFIAPYGILYRLFNSPLILLFIQAAAITGAGYLLIGYCFKLSKINYWYLFCLYLLYSPVWYNALFDFHFEHLFILFCAIFFTIIQYDSAKMKLAAFVLCLGICMIKEVFAFSAFTMGLYLIVRKKWCLTGFIISFFAVCYIYFMVIRVIPFFSSGHGPAALWNMSFGYLGDSLPEICKNLLVHPWIIIENGIDAWGKGLYFIALFGPFVFLPVLSPLELLPAFPQLLISLLSTNPNHYSFQNQYTAGLIVPCFIAFAHACRFLNSSRLQLWKKPVLKIIMAFSVLIHIVFSPSPISNFFWNSDSWFYHYTAYHSTIRDDRIKHVIENVIPGDNDVVVSIQNSLNHALLAERKYIFCFPTGVYKPGITLSWDGSIFNPGKVETFSKIADFVVIDLQRPLFIADKGENPETNVEFNKLVARMRLSHSIAFEEDGFIIFKRQNI